MNYDGDHRIGDHINGARVVPALAPGKSTLTSRIQRRVIADAPSLPSTPATTRTTATTPETAAPSIDPFGLHLIGHLEPVQRTAAAGHLELHQAVSIDAPKAFDETRATLDVRPRDEREVAVTPRPGTADESVGSATPVAAQPGGPDGHMRTQEAVTIDAPKDQADLAGPVPARLNTQQLATARRRNAHHARRLRFDVAAFGGASPDSTEFALAVATYQAGTGGALGIDGIAGPQTCKHKGCLPAVNGQATDHSAPQSDDDGTSEHAAMATLESTRGHRDAVGAADRAQPSAIDAPKEVDNTRATLPIQARATGPRAVGPEQVHAHAAAGVQGPGGTIPHGDAIKKSFGAHAPIIDAIQAHVGGGAAAAATAIGAEAYATGTSVAFRASPDLFTAAHEAAHVVQQRAGVHLIGGVGETGDNYEQNADEVAAAVVAGENAEHLLAPSSGSSPSSVQRRDANHDGSHDAWEESSSFRTPEDEVEVNWNQHVKWQAPGSTFVVRDVVPGNVVPMPNDAVLASAQPRQHDDNDPVPLRTASGLPPVVLNHNDLVRRQAHWEAYAQAASLVQSMQEDIKADFDRFIAAEQDPNLKARLRRSPELTHLCSPEVVHLSDPDRADRSARRCR